jgi:hypothetical protein
MPSLLVAVQGVLSNIVPSPPVLFFFLGALAAFVKSNLRVPKAITKLLSLYLLWAIGFRGGVELLHGGTGTDVLMSLGLAILMAVTTPVYTYFILRRKLDAPNAAALSATYGSISAVTFMTACTVLDSKGIAHGGHMVAAMALMESPAIVIAVMLLRLTTREPTSVPEARAGIPWGKLLHEAFLNGPVLVLLGSLAIGIATGDEGYAAFKPLCTDLFSGVLVFFLLDLGLVAARRSRALREQGAFLTSFSILLPLGNAALAIALARVCGLSPGNAVLLAVLGASGSYIAVPAAMRLVIPKANPGLYISMPLAVTFPFNIAIGIPLYLWIVRQVWHM